MKAYFIEKEANLDQFRSALHSISKYRTLDHSVCSRFGYFFSAELGNFLLKKRLASIVDNRLRPKFDLLQAPDVNTMKRIKDIIRQSRRMAKENLGQHPATANSVIRRATKIMQDSPLHGKKIVVLGDDDLVSIALALLCKLSHTPVHISVMDIDDELIKTIQDLSAKYSLDLSTYINDLRDPLPRRLRGSFDIFETDPYWSLNGVRTFLLRAREAIRKESSARGYLSFSHPQNRETKLFNVEHVILKLRFSLVEIVREFSSYPFQEAVITGSPHYRWGPPSREVTLDLSFDPDEFNTKYSFLKVKLGSERYPAFFSDLFVLRPLHEYR